MVTFRKARKPHRLAMFHAYFLVIFLVLFPKGGIKAGSTPLTWGYLYLALSTPLLALVRLLAMPWRLQETVLATVAVLVPMQLLLAYAYLVNGVVNTGYAISMVTGLCVLPWVFLLVYPPFLRLVDPEGLARCFRWCMLLAAIWGIFLFFLHPVTGHYIEIPYLTVNAADYGLLETTKYNARGFYLKLISTYNNGNLYGVAMLILLPLYNTIEPARWKRGVLLAAMLLTLSRTVWVGLLALQLAPLVMDLARQLETFPVLHLGKAARRTFSVLLILGLVVVVLFSTTNSGLEFLLDPTLGGRANELRATNDMTFLPPGGLTGFDESLYASAASYYGLTGLVSFSLIMLSPLLMLALDPSALRSRTRMAAFSGLMMYSFVSFSDGALCANPGDGLLLVYLYGLPAWLARNAEARACPRSTGADTLGAGPESLLSGTPGGHKPRRISLHS